MRPVPVPARQRSQLDGFPRCEPVFTTLENAFYKMSPPSTDAVTDAAGTADHENLLTAEIQFVHRPLILFHLIRITSGHGAVDARMRLKALTSPYQGVIFCQTEREKPLASTGKNAKEKRYDGHDPPASSAFFR